MQVTAKCGKRVKASQLQRHESLCTKCKGEAPKEAIPMNEVPKEPPVNHAQEKTPETPTQEAQLNALVMAVAQKVVEIIAPEINKSLAEVKTLAQEAQKAILSQEQQAQQIQLAVKAEITKLVEDTRATQGGNGHAQVADDTPIAIPQGGGGLADIIRMAMPLFNKQQSEGGIESLVRSMESIAKLESVVMDRYFAPLNRAKMETLQEVKMLAQLSGNPDIDKVAKIVEGTIPKPKPKPEQPNVDVS